MQNRAKKRASCSTCHAKKQAVPHVAKKQAVPHIMQKTSCSTCHAKPMQKTSCSTCCKNMQKTSCSTCCKKPCKNHAKCAAYGAPTRRTLTLPGSLLYVLYVLYLTRQPTEHHSPRVAHPECKNMFIRHVLQMLKQRNPGRVRGLARLQCRAGGAASMRASGAQFCCNIARQQESTMKQF